jgi:hypothetical protein
MMIPLGACGEWMPFLPGGLIIDAGRVTRRVTPEDGMLDLWAR